MERGLVSTIIPVYNRAPMLREAVASVLAQTYRPIEIIIVDDGSTDDTPAAIADLVAQHPEVRATRRANGGPRPARGSGRPLARGGFIQHPPNDAPLPPPHFAGQGAPLPAHPQAGPASGWTRLR